MEQEPLQDQSPKAPVTRLQQLKELFNTIQGYPWPFFCVVFIYFWYQEHQDHKTDNKNKDAEIKAVNDFSRDHLIDDTKESKADAEINRRSFQNLQNHAVDTIFLRNDNTAGAGRPQY